MWEKTEKCSSQVSIRSITQIYHIYTDAEDLKATNHHLLEDGTRERSNDLISFDHFLLVFTADFWEILNTKCFSSKKTLNQWSVKVETSSQIILYQNLIEGELQNNKLFWFTFLPFFSRVVSILEVNRPTHGPVTLHGHSAGCRRVWSLLLNSDRNRQTNKRTSQTFNHKFMFKCIKI